MFTTRTPDPLQRLHTCKNNKDTTDATLRRSFSWRPLVGRGGRMRGRDTCRGGGCRGGSTQTRASEALLGGSTQTRACEAWLHGGDLKTWPLRFSLRGKEVRWRPTHARGELGRTEQALLGHLAPQPLETVGTLRRLRKCLQPSLPALFNRLLSIFLILEPFLYSFFFSKRKKYSSRSALRCIVRR